jgi:hypothetical protein
MANAARRRLADEGTLRTAQHFDGADVEKTLLQQDRFCHQKAGLEHGDAGLNVRRYLAALG